MGMSDRNRGSRRLSPRKKRIASYAATEPDVGSDIAISRISSITSTTKRVLCQPSQTGQRGIVFFSRPERKTHVQEVATNYVGKLLQHDSSYHRWFPYAQEKWHLITSLDDYSKVVALCRLCGKKDQLGPHRGFWSVPCLAMAYRYLIMWITTPYSGLCKAEIVFGRGTIRLL